MKRINAIIIIFIVVIASLLYKNISLYFDVRIEPVKTLRVPLYGEWTVSKYQEVGQTDLTDEEIKNFIGKKAIFSGFEAKFNNDVCKRPNYKIKVVDSEKYFLSNFKIKASELGINQKQVKIITISSRNSFYDEYVQINDNYILKNYEGVMLFLKKNVAVTNKPKELKEIRGKDKEEKKRSLAKNGVLIGLRQNTSSGYQYRTIWIYNQENKFDIKEMNNLIVPRKNGFMMVGVDKINKNGAYVRDEIWTGTLNTAANSIVKNTHNGVQNNTNYKIDFVGNEYISLESSSVNINDIGKYITQSHLSVLPLDNIYGSSIAFSKIIGNNNDDLLSKNAEEYLWKNGKSDYKVDKGELETNWGIVRYNGKWILKGMVANENFNVNVEPPKVLTTYDQLTIPFKTIQSRFPDAIDVYISLNNSFMIVITKNELKIVSIVNNSIGKVQKTIGINENEQGVMSQWAIGTYVDKWNMVFKNIK